MGVCALVDDAATKHTIDVLREGHALDLRSHGTR